MKPNTTTPAADKAQIISALRRFIAQRPGFDPRNYDSATSYRSDTRKAQRDGATARLLLAAVEHDPAITALDLLRASEGAFSGRLSIDPIDPNGSIEYTTGQYFPTEYRAAACAVLASALWSAKRQEITAKAEHQGGGHSDCLGDALRTHFRRQFGPAIQKRFFD